MGTKKLKGVLSKSLELAPPLTDLPHQAHLFIDGYGFMNFIRGLIPEDVFHPDLGGCYDVYDKALRTYIKKLQSRDITITVFIDAYSDLPFKGEELKTRSLVKNRVWVKL
jgi:hypothetical protein